MSTRLSVHATLADNRVDRAAGTDAKQPSLLAGLVFDESGERLTPSHAVKKSTRYRYYVSRSLITGTAKDKSNGRRILAGNLERLVINKLRDFLADQRAMLDALGHERPNGAAQSWRGLKIAEGLLSLAPDRMRAMLMALSSRVDIRPDCVEINVRRSCLIDLLSKDSIDSVIQGDSPEQDVNDILTLKVPARLQRVGREMKMLVENSDDQTKADPGLLRIIARAHDLQERVMQTNDLTLHAIASQEHVTPGYISRLLRLPSLAPDIIVVNGKNPPQLTAKKLMRLALELPVDWIEQRKLLGFQ